MGDLICDTTPHEFTKTMKTTSMFLGEAGEQFTCKAFRSGRATELVKQNVSFGAILDMGGWSTKHAARRYIREEHVDPNHFTRCLLQESDDEL